MSFDAGDETHRWIMASSAAAVGAYCRLHGAGCTVPWGYDEAHTDSDRPYTLAELEERREPPHFYAYPDAAGYLLGFDLWKAIRRDQELNPEEAAVRWAGIEERLKERLRDE